MTPRFTVVSTAGEHVSGRAPLREDAAVDDAPRSAAERRDAIASLTLQLQAETKAEREAFTTELAKAIRNARRISLEDHHPVGIRRYAEEVAEALEPKLLGMRALMEREG